MTLGPFHVTISVLFDTFFQLRISFVNLIPRLVVSVIFSLGCMLQGCVKIIQGFIKIINSTVYIVLGKSFVCLLNLSVSFREGEGVFLPGFALLSPTYGINREGNI